MTNLLLLINYFPLLLMPLVQFSSMSDQGTRIVIYNLWEDDQGELELDFGADIHVSLTLLLHLL